MGTTHPEQTAEGSDPGPVSPEAAQGPAGEPARDEPTPTAPLSDPSLETLRALEADLEPYFPAPFDETELVLMDVDPRRIHAYWHVSPTDLEAAGFAGPSAPLVLRVYDVTDAAAGSAPTESFDVDVQGLESRCYVDLWQPGRTYEAELALRSPDGALQSLAHSNRVQTPPAPADGGARLELEPPPPEALEPAPLPTGQPATSEAPAPPPAVSGEAAEAPPTGGAVDRGPRAGALQEPAGPAGSEGETVEAALCEPPSALSPEFPNPAPEDGRSADAGVPAEAPAGAHEAAGGGAVPGGRPEEGQEVSPPQAERPGSTTAPLVTLSSSTLAGHPLVLEVHAELHVFGRARPGSRLRVFGRPVALRPDGSFSVRRPLPAGALVLPLELEEPGPEAAGSPEGS